MFDSHINFKNFCYTSLLLSWSAFPSQSVAVSHCVAGGTPVVASGATRREVSLASLFPAVARRESVRPVVATAADLKELLNPLGGLTAATPASPAFHL